MYLCKYTQEIYTRVTLFVAMVGKDVCELNMWAVKRLFMRICILSDFGII